jgi:hypothetical protein
MDLRDHRLESMENYHQINLGTVEKATVFSDIYLRQIFIDSRR